MTAATTDNPATDTTELGRLLALRVAAKRGEDVANDWRRKIDAQIIELVKDSAKSEGAVTHRDGNLKLTVTYGVTRKVNTAQLQAAWETLTPALQSAFKFSADVVAANARLLGADDSLTYSRFVTSTPSSPSIALALA